MENFCGLFSLWPGAYSIGSYFILPPYVFKRSPVKQRRNGCLMGCKPEIGVPKINLATVSYQLVPASTWVSHGWPTAKECLWIYFLWLNFLFHSLTEFFCPALFGILCINFFGRIWSIEKFICVLLYIIFTVRGSFDYSSEWYVAVR